MEDFLESRSICQGYPAVSGICAVSTCTNVHFIRGLHPGKCSQAFYASLAFLQLCESKQTNKKQLMCFLEGVRGDQSQSFNKGKLSACLLLTSAPGEETRAQGRQGGTEPVCRLKSPTKKATESGRSTCHTSPPTPAAGLSVVSVSPHPVSFQQILATQTHHLCIPVLRHISGP